MPNSRDIKRRIASVKSTGQITKAMKLVASSKVTKAKTKVMTNRFYFENLKAAVKHAMTAGKVDSPFIRSDEELAKLKTKLGRPDEKKNVLYIVLSSDKGLCGGFNINLFKEMMTKVDSSNENVFAVSGRKAREYCKRKSLNVIFERDGISESPLYEDAKEFGNFAIDKYLKNEVDEVYLVYTHFKSIITQEQKVFKLLPFDASADAGDYEEDEEMKTKENIVKPLTLYEPSAEAVLNYVIPKYTHGVIYGAFLESAASELGSRMTAMDNATTNAGELVDNLTLTYNRIRQSSITTEISEIVGGANALNA